MTDQNYLLDITYSGGTFTFPITPEYFPDLDFNWKRDGSEVAVIDKVPVHGWFDRNDQDSIWTDWAILRAIANNGIPVSVVFRKEDNTPLATFGFAFIRNLKSRNTGAGFVNHVEFDFLITEERGVRFPGLVDVGKEDDQQAEVKEDGTVVHRLVRQVYAIGQYGDLNAATNFVTAQKPALSRMRFESIKTTSYDGKVTGTWTFDNTPDKKGNNIKRWVEKTAYSPGQKTHAWWQSPKQSPLLLRGGLDFSSVSVSGRILTYDKKSVPSMDAIVTRVKGKIGAVTPVQLVSPSFGGFYPDEFDAIDPNAVSVWAVEYSFGLEYGEAPSPAPAFGPEGQFGQSAPGGSLPPTQVV